MRANHKAGRGIPPLSFSVVARVPLCVIAPELDGPLPLGEYTLSRLAVLLRAHRLLLRQAMERPQAEHQVAAVDADDLAVREDLG